MIIKSVYIDKFGCLSDSKMEFDNGMNVISMPNESGKSTMAEFIRVMLYGVNSLRFNQRKKYMPFGHSAMGGQLTVDCGGTEYIICRTFGNRKSDDKIDVYNKSTSARIDEYSVDNVGEILCGISGDTFENTCYIKQLACEINEDKSGELQSRLINLSQSGNEDYSYRKAVNILDSEIRELTKPRGKINNIQAMINDLVLKRAEKLRIKGEYQQCVKDLERLNREKTKDKISVVYPAILFLLAVVFLILTIAAKPVWLFGMLTVLFLAIAAVLTFKRRVDGNLSMEHARKIGYYESKQESLKTEYEKIDISMLNEYNAKLQKYNTALNDLRYAKAVLAEAFEELQQDYVPRLNGTAMVIFKTITSGKYIDFMVDDKYNITVRDSENRLVAKEYLSTGTFHQIYFSLRMALVSMIAQDMPVILDDAFSMYDNIRLKYALEYLKNVNNQVIVFSCQDREKILLDD